MPVCVCVCIVPLAYVCILTAYWISLCPYGRQWVMWWGPLFVHNKPINHAARLYFLLSYYFSFYLNSCIFYIVAQIWYTTWIVYISHPITFFFIVESLSMVQLQLLKYHLFKTRGNTNPSMSVQCGLSFSLKLNDFCIQMSPHTCIVRFFIGVSKNVGGLTQEIELYQFKSHSWQLFCSITNWVL